MNTALDAARARLAAIEQEAEKLRRFVNLWEELAAVLGDGSTVPAPMETAPIGAELAKEMVDHFAPQPPQRTKSARTMDNPKPAVVIPAVLEIIRKHGKPMSRRDIHAALKQRGLEVKGANPIKALGTMLWRARHNDLVSLEGYGYWPKADTYAPARYNGDLHDLLGPLLPSSFAYD